MKKLSILIAALALLLGSCKDDKEEVLAERDDRFELSLKAGGTTVSLFDTVGINNNGERLYLSMFKVYLSDIYLTKKGGGREKIKAICLLSPGDANDRSFDFALPEGEYTGIQFGVGVEPGLNNTLPESYAPEHPLSAEQTMYWTMLKYRFARFEGVSFSPDSIASLSYHPGTDPLYQQKEISFAQDISVDETGSYELKLSIAFPHLFDGEGGIIQLPEENQSHSEPDDIHISEKFMKNLAGSIHVESFGAVE